MDEGGGREREREKEVEKRSIKAKNVSIVASTFHSFIFLPLSLIFLQ